MESTKFKSTRYNYSVEWLIYIALYSLCEPPYIEPLYNWWCPKLNQSQPLHSTASSSRVGSDLPLRMPSPRLALFMVWF